MLQVAVQLGLVGFAILCALWFAQILLFHRSGLPGWLGMGVVAQAFVGSLFLSFLFDFTTGWIYVFGVGVLGGMALARKHPAPPRGESASPTS
jgi:hypothetical protein